MTALVFGFATVLAVIANDVLGIVRPASPYRRQLAFATAALVIILLGWLVVRLSLL
jgi:hypothetical protein